MATFQRNTSQLCWASIYKPRPNDRNIVGRNMMRAFGQTVGTCCACCKFKIELVRMTWRNIVARTWPYDYNIM